MSWDRVGADLRPMTPTQNRGRTRCGESAPLLEPT